MPFDKYLTVSPIGISTTPATLLPNNGADYGPDTPGTTTSGIQEALDKAAESSTTPNSNEVVGRVVLLPGGVFYIKSMITWPPDVTTANLWTGILEGQGDLASGSESTAGTVIMTESGFGTSTYTAMLTLGNAYNPDGGTLTKNIQVRNIRFVLASGTSASHAVIDLQQHDTGTNVYLWNVAADMTQATTSPPSTCIDFSGNQVSTLYNCIANGGPLTWWTKGGSVRVVGGVYDTGMKLICQGALLLGVRVQQITVGDSTQTGTFAQPVRNSFYLVGCARVSDTNPVLVNSSGQTIFVRVSGGIFACAPGTSYFSATSSASQINLSLESVCLQNTGSSIMALFDSGSANHQLVQAVGLNLQGSISINESAQSTVGFANPNQLAVGFKQAGTTSNVNIFSNVTVDPNNDTMVRVQIAIANSSASVTDSVTASVVYVDAVSGVSKNVQVYHNTALGLSSQLNFVGVFQVQANGTVRVQFTAKTTTYASAAVSRLI